jgi:16S rRNA (cytosine1402-N4)-methyltransferase
MALDRSSRAVHRPILLDEVLGCLDPRPGNVVVDCTVGSGSHARALLERIQPGGRLIGIDVDPVELSRTEARLSSSTSSGTMTFMRANFRDLPVILAKQGIDGADIVFADLGVSSMQHDTPSRGFHYKFPGPLDMRMDQSSGEPAADLIARLDEGALAAVLSRNADEPHAVPIAALLKRERFSTTHHLERAIRTALLERDPRAPRASVKASVRRTFQALRIEVNDERGALDALLAALPTVLGSGGRTAIITFHSGEDNRVDAAFRAGLENGVYSAISPQEIRTRVEETRANRRALSAKLRWAIRA